MTFTTTPPDFSPKFDVVGCYVEYDDKVLILKRQSHKPQGSQYGLPAGKVDAGEDLAQAIMREIKEETGITILPENLRFVKSFPTRYPGYDFIFHVFTIHLLEKPEITINPSEHSEYRWVCPKDILTLSDGMEDFASYTQILYSL